MIRTRLNQSGSPKLRMAQQRAAEGVTDSACACAPHTLTPLRIQMKDVVTMARMVPVGIDFWASLRSPDRFEPAMMPAETDRHLSGWTQPGPQLQRRELKTTPAWGRCPQARPQRAQPITVWMWDGCCGHLGKAPSVPHTLHGDSESHHELRHSRDQSKAQPRHLPSIPKPEATSGCTRL